MKTYHIRLRGMLPGTIKADSLTMSPFGQYIFKDENKEVICGAPADSFVKLLKKGEIK